MERCEPGIAAIDSFLYADATLAKDTKIKLDWKTGIEATNWDDVAKKENLDLMATELRKLEDTVKEIHNEMKYLRKREEQMRNLNGARLQPSWL